MRPLNQGLITAGSATKFRSFVDLTFVPVTLLLMCSTTQNRYQGVIRNYLVPAFGESALRDITPLAVQRYFSEMGNVALTLESRSKIRDILSRILGSAVQYGLLVKNPVEGVRLPPAKRGKRSKPYARCVHISSYWAYIPIERTPLSETHPLTGGPLPVRLRREAEDILREAGSAVVNLPDFYGPEVHTSTLQRALAEAVAGKTVHWIGSPETAREYVFIPDAMKAVTELAFCEQAYGERWIVPGPGPITFRRVMEIAASSLGRRPRIRAAGPLALRIFGLFVSELRSFLPLVPAYVAPISYDGSKIRALLGDVPTTPYEVAIPRTLEWLAVQAGKASE